MEFKESLNEGAKKEHFLYIGSSAVLVATGANLLDTKYKVCGFK